jgi:hypothetical protein
MLTAQKRAKLTEQSAKIADKSIEALRSELFLLCAPKRHNDIACGRRYFGFSFSDAELMQ